MHEASKLETWDALLLGKTITRKAKLLVTMKVSQAFTLHSDHVAKNDVTVLFLSDFDVSRKSSAIVYSTNRTGQWQLMLLDRLKDTSRQLTFDNEGKFGPEFSPKNEDIILFAKDFDGDEKFDIYLADLKQGNTVN